MNTVLGLLAAWYAAVVIDVSAADEAAVASEYTVVHPGMPAHTGPRIRVLTHHAAVSPDWMAFCWLSDRLIQPPGP